MPRWGMVIDLDRCTGCQACSIACRTENNVPFCGDKNAARGRAIFWNKVIAVRPEEGEHRAGRPGASAGASASAEAAVVETFEVEGDSGGEAKVTKAPHLRGRTRFLPLPCMHCDNSPCTKLCPVRATFR